MADLARAVATPCTPEEVFTQVTAAAVELIPPVDTAGILLITKGGEFESHAGTTEVPHQLDELQRTLQEGPCMSAALDDVVVRADDFRTETRWPAYSAAVVQLGVLSSLSVRLYTHERTTGAINVFGFAPTVWNAERQLTATVLAAHAAAAVSAHVQAGQLQSALLTRDRIGQAKGVIMERFGVDDVAAFGMLRRLSQESNTLLVDIAQQVIDTRG